MMRALEHSSWLVFSSAAMRENVAAIARSEKDAIELLEALVDRWFRT
jgi:hypothetical protein